MPNTRNKTEVQLSRKLVVKASNLRKMDEEAVMQLVGKLLDVAQDAGAKVGPQNDSTTIITMRYDIRITGAGPIRARRLRQAPGRSLRESDRRRTDPGRTTGAVEPRRAGADRGGPGNLGPRRPSNSNSDDESSRDMPRKRLETSKYQDIPVKVELMVRFQVHSKPDAKGQDRREMTNPERDPDRPAPARIDPPRVPGRPSPGGDRRAGRRRLARESPARLGERIPKSYPNT